MMRTNILLKYICVPKKQPCMKTTLKTACTVNELICSISVRHNMLIVKRFPLPGHSIISCTSKTVY